ncbi:flippase-like domain-containing protein [archaeon]|nr:flippase-like domain-containing protein [archaeon]
MNLLKNKLFLRIIGIIIFAYILSKVELQEVSSILKQIDLTYFLIGLLFFVPAILIKAYRWQRILHLQKIRIKIRKLISPYIGTFGLGIITPFKVGELARIAFLKNKKIPLATSAFGVLMDRLLDIILFTTIGIISMIYLFSYFKEYLLTLLIILLGLILVTILIVSKSKAASNIILSMFLPKGIIKKTQLTIKELWKEFRRIDLIFFIEVIAITALSWILANLEIYLFAFALGINLTLWQIIILVSISSIANLLPITISGIGTRDATFIFIFAIFGLTSEQAVALSLLILIAWIIKAFLCMLFWWKTPIIVKNNEN